MQPKSRLAVFQDYFAEYLNAGEERGMHALGLDCELERAGLTVVSTEVVAAFAAIVAYGGVSSWSLQVLLARLGLGTIVPFDPAKHDAQGAVIEPGAEYLEYAPRLVEALRLARPHLRGGLN
ncbi:hypothetical protein [Bradyrhizobium sp. STM 3557]|uniref:hypothetical protein n=1 Tax=Bradyrhizobium sp. STM 3557 TaxID=578920 RepID=UPI00388D60A0